MPGVRVVSAAEDARCHFMSDAEDNILRVRPAFLLWTLGGIGWLVIMVVIAAWFILPRWQPELVMEKSPWFAPAFSAAAHAQNTETYFDRLPEWGTSIVPSLTHSLHGSDLNEARLAFRSLKKIKPASYAEILIKAVSVPDDELAGYIIQALVDIKSIRALPAIIDRLPSLAPEPGLDAAHIAGTLPATDRFILTSSLRLSTDSRLRGLACLLLHADTDPRSLTYLHEQIGQCICHLGRGRVERDMAVFALIYNPTTEAAQIVAAELQHPDIERRRRAMVSAYAIKQPDLIHLVITGIDDPDPEIQRSAAYAIAPRTDPDSLNALSVFLTKAGTPALALLKTLRYRVRTQHIPILLAHCETPNLASTIIGLIMRTDLTSTQIDSVIQAMERLSPDDAKVQLNNISSLPMNEEQRQRVRRLRETIRTPE